MANEIKVLDGDGNSLYYNVLKTGATGDSFLPIPADLYLAIQLGLVPKYSIVHKYGRNPATANGSWQGVLQMAAQFYFPTAATTVRVKAGGHANDTAAGAGAQAVTVLGLDDTGALASESIELAGASASSSTSTSFWRIFRAYITPLRAGAYGGTLPTTAIMIEDTAGANDMITILAGEGQTQYGAYAIPLATTGYLLSIAFSSESSKVKKHSAIGTPVRNRRERPVFKKP